ncbi:amidohydrolase [Methanolobus sp.]|uniref:M20 metallopeptidase family protein n=1 Tax=Methanolobus sp. TaxID=1874737 RepID=UPI0025E42B3D|nr:amidohydrolase [Methanolobus sp.]
MRREFHRGPELSYAEYRTQERIMSVLGELGINCEKIADTGVVANVHGRSRGPCIAIRSDMDALAVTEKLTGSNKDYISGNKGVMHACGHDGHMAILLGTARLLKERQDSFSGTVRLIFQPAEEVPPGGAQRVIEQGGLEGVDAVIGLHIFGDVDMGVFNIRAGPCMASSNRFRICIFGKGGHHSTPASCVDPVRIAAEFITTLYSELPGHVNPENYVFGIGALSSGSQFNRTPDELEMDGSFRTFDNNDSMQIERIMRDILDRLMAKHSIKDLVGLPHYSIDVEAGYPVLMNDAKFARAAVRVLRNNHFDVNEDAGRIFGAEDFAFYLQRVPGIFAILGTRNPEKKIMEINHSSSFDIDEDVLLIGTKAFCTLVLDFLKDPGDYLSA